MSRKKLLFVFNPNSGKAVTKSHLFEIVDILSTSYDVTVYPTKGRLDAYEKLRLDGGDYHTVVISGGDGTLSEAVRGIVSLPEASRPPIGYIPTGTANDFASTLGISSDIRRAAEDILTGRELACDIGRFGETTFNYIAAFGAFTDVAYDTPQQYKNLLGHTAYILEGISRLSAIKPIRMSITCPDIKIEEEYIYGMITNSTSVGGMQLAGEGVSLSDGYFELLLVRMPRSMTDLSSILHGIASRDFSGELFCRARCESVSFVADSPVKWTLDGEYGGSHEWVTVTCMKQAVRFITGAENEAYK